MPAKPRPEPVGSYRAQLGESPVWHSSRNELVWIDGLSRRLLRTDAESGINQVVSLPSRPGSVTLSESGDIIAALGHEIVQLVEGQPSKPLAALPQDTPGRFNDGKPDAVGRLWIGTASPEGRPACALYSYKPETSFELVVSGVKMSNGLDWSPDNRILYYVDTGTGRLDAFDFDVHRGTIANRRTVLQLPSGQLPDGLTVDNDGRVYLAVWGGSVILVLAPDGRIENTIEVPTLRVSSCTFGGADYRTLFITTAQEGASEDELATDPLAGALFAVQIGAQGRPPNRFHISLR